MNLKDFNKNGIITLNNVLKENDLDKFYQSILQISYFHLRKLKDKKKLVDRIYNSKKNIGDKLSKMYELFEKNDKEVLYQLQKLFPKSYDTKNILNNQNLISIFKKLLNLKKDEPILIDGPGLFINRPKTKRLLYKWHSESHYYPKRRNFLNIWFPIFFNKNPKNGTMFIKEKSHLLNDLPFNEYQGYDVESQGKRNHFVQLEIPENFVKKLKTFKANLNVGDLLVFHRKSIHTSTQNLSSKYSFAVVFRVWDFSKDLTISGDLNVSPYRDLNNGRPNLEVSF